MRMAVVNAADGVSGITAKGHTVWDLQNKSGEEWVNAELCHDQSLTLQLQ
jgi:hypothetical protein